MRSLQYNLITCPATEWLAPLLNEACKRAYLSHTESEDSFIILNCLVLTRLEHPPKAISWYWMLLSLPFLMCLSLVWNCKCGIYFWRFVWVELQWYGYVKDTKYQDIHSRLVGSRSVTHCMFTEKLQINAKHHFEGAFVEGQCHAHSARSVLKGRKVFVVTSELRRLMQRVQGQ